MKKNLSWKAFLIDAYLSVKKPKSIFSETSDLSFNRIVKGFEKETAKPLKTPHGFQETSFQSRQVFLFNSKSKQDILFFLSGDTYLQNPTKSHFALIQSIAEQNGLSAVVPIFGRAPERSYASEFQIVISLYHKILDENPNRRIFLMGDGAGGAFAAGLHYCMEGLNLRKPDETILLSPWLDATLTNPKIEALEDKDAILSPWGLRKIALLWAGNESALKNRHISPIYGDTSELKNISVICGSEEILFPDITKFDSFMEQKRVRHQLFVFEGMSHGFYLYATKEAEKVKAQIHQIFRP